MTPFPKEQDKVWAGGSEHVGHAVLALKNRARSRTGPSPKGRVDLKAHLKCVTVYILFLLDCFNSMQAGMQWKCSFE